MFRLTKKRGRRHKSADSLLVTAPVQQEKTKKAFSLLLPGKHIGRHTRSLGVVCNSSVSVCLFVVHACRPQAQGRAGARIPQVSQRRMHRTHEAPPPVSLALPPRACSDGAQHSVCLSARTTAGEVVENVMARLPEEDEEEYQLYVQFKFGCERD